mmetsp:Transcript_69183/g.205934  ORF Transcript_69183/g.205934 Transcript_69183/m.205934 type:complete len:232 (+) Transcript_69183:1005-1700(+)
MTSAHLALLSKRACHAFLCDKAHPHPPSVRWDEQSSGSSAMVARFMFAALCDMIRASSVKSLSPTSCGHESSSPFTAAILVMFALSHLFGPASSSMAFFRSSRRSRLMNKPMPSSSVSVPIGPTSRGSRGSISSAPSWGTIPSRSSSRTWIRLPSSSRSGLPSSSTAKRTSSTSPSASPWTSTPCSAGSAATSSEDSPAAGSGDSATVISTDSTATASAGSATAGWLASTS